MKKRLNMIKQRKAELRREKITYVADNFDKAYKICNKKQLKTIKAIYYDRDKLLNAVFNEFLRGELLDEDIANNFYAACNLVRYVYSKSKPKIDPDAIFLTTFNYLSTKKFNIEKINKG